MVLWKLSELSDVPTKKEDKFCDLSFMVGLHIEISNRFIEDYERVVRFMKWHNSLQLR